MQTRFFLRLGWAEHADTSTLIPEAPLYSFSTTCHPQRRPLEMDCGACAGSGGSRSACPFRATAAGSSKSAWALQLTPCVSLRIAVPARAEADLASRGAVHLALSLVRTPLRQVHGNINSSSSSSSSSR